MTLYIRDRDVLWGIMVKKRFLYHRLILIRSLYQNTSMLTGAGKRLISPVKTNIRDRQRWRHIPIAVSQAIKHNIDWVILYIPKMLLPNNLPKMIYTRKYSIYKENKKVRFYNIFTQAKINGFCGEICSKNYNRGK